MSGATLAKWLILCLRTKWLWVRVPLQSLKQNNVIKLEISNARMVRVVRWICNHRSEDSASSRELKNRNQINTMMKCFQSRRLLQPGYIERVEDSWPSECQNFKVRGSVAKAWLQKICSEVISCGDLVSASFKHIYSFKKDLTLTVLCQIGIMGQILCFCVKKVYLSLLGYSLSILIQIFYIP